LVIFPRLSTGGPKAARAAGQRQVNLCHTARIYEKLGESMISSGGCLL